MIQSQGQEEGSGIVSGENPEWRDKNWWSAEGRAPDQLADEGGHALASDAEIPTFNTPN